MRKIPTLLLLLGLTAQTALADPPEITDVRVHKTGMVWSVHVELRHPDTGWDHYADGWEVLDASGNSLGHRKLMHPHVEEQPFTRSLNGLVFPDGTREIFIRAKCSEHGWNTQTVRVELKP